MHRSAQPSVPAQESEEVCLDLPLSLVQLLVQTCDLQGAAFHAQSLSWAERYSEARYHLTPLLHAARHLASPAILSLALGMSDEIGWWSGQWMTARGDAIEALQWATETASPAFSATASAWWRASSRMR
jgi:hypothetical protein